MPVSKKSSHEIPFSFLCWMVIFTIVTALCGVCYATLKNEHVAVRTEINKIEREIAERRMNTKQYQAKATGVCNRWAMRDKLAQMGSDLQDIDRNQIETARSMGQTDIHTACR